MSLQEILSIAGVVLFGVGGGVSIALSLSKWLGGVWASRILEDENLKRRIEQDLFNRRREVYSKIATSLRVFLSAQTPATQDQKSEFQAAHDEVFLWATEDVYEKIGAFLDLQVKHASNPESVSMSEMQASYQTCMREMRKDAGYPSTHVNYRIVSF